MLRRPYARLLALAATAAAPWWLAAVAFAESSVLPLPPDALLVPMVLARPARAWRFALVATAGSVAGGLFGYAIGYSLFDVAARPLLRLYGYEAAFAHFQASYRHWGVWIILLKGLTPIPYKLVTIASGAARFDLLTFVLASVVTRGARFLLEAALLRFYGDRARVLIERRLGMILLGSGVALVLGVVLAGAL